MICRILRCTIRETRGQAPPTESENPGETPKAKSFDDLTRIRGIGLTTENRLYRAGIRSYADLGRATPEKLQEILGNDDHASRPNTETTVSGRSIVPDQA